MRRRGASSMTDASPWHLGSPDACSAVYVHAMTASDVSPQFVPAPLAGVRIVSLALNLPGPAALMRLRGMGAECHKIEPPGTMPLRADLLGALAPGAYATLHEGIAVHRLDLKNDDGHAALNLLLRDADVLLTSFRPAALHRLGIDGEALVGRFPQLAIVNIVGAHGTAADHPGHDLTYQADAGLIVDCDLPVSLFADMAGALFITEAVLRALRLRTVAPHARLVEEVALTDAARFLALPRTWGLLDPRGPLGGADAGYAVYRCRDGRVAVAALEPRLALAACRATGLSEQEARQLQAADMRQHLTAYFAAHSAADLTQLALREQLPWHVMAD